MMYNIVPRPYINGRIKDPIPIYIDDESAVSKILQGMITLIPEERYPQIIYDAAKLSNM